MLSAAQSMSGRRLREVWQEVGSVGSTQARDGIPSFRCGVTRDRCRLIVANGHVEEVSGVLRGVGCNLVQSRIDITQIASRNLVGNGYQTRPLRCAATCATEDVPTGTARVSPAATGTRGFRSGFGHIDKRSGCRACLESDVRNASHVGV